jgi:hypothetical protein
LLNDLDNYSVHFYGPGAGNSGEFAVAAVNLFNGSYRAQFYPQIAGSYTVHVTLNGVDIKGSPYNAIVHPGEVKSSLCFTTIAGTPINNIAGITYFFTVQLVDVYGNHLTSFAQGTRVDVVARYQNHDSWLSPIAIPDASNWQAIYGRDIAGLAVDNGDGTMTA